MPGKETAAWRAKGLEEREKTLRWPKRAPSQVPQRRQHPACLGTGVLSYQRRSSRRLRLRSRWRSLGIRRRALLRGAGGLRLLPAHCCWVLGEPHWSGAQTVQTWVTAGCGDWWGVGTHNLRRSLAALCTIFAGNKWLGRIRGRWVFFDPWLALPSEGRRGPGRLPVPCGEKRNGSNYSLALPEGMLATTRMLLSMMWTLLEGPGSRYRLSTNLWRTGDTQHAGPRLTLGGHGEGVGRVSHLGHGSPKTGSQAGRRLASCGSKGSPREGDLGWKGSPVRPPTPSRTSSNPASPLGHALEQSLDSAPLPTTPQLHKPPAPPILHMGTHPGMLGGGHGGCCSSSENSGQSEQPGPGIIGSCGEEVGLDTERDRGCCNCRAKKLSCCFQHHTGKAVPKHCPCHQGSEWPLPHFALSLPSVLQMLTLSPTTTPSPGTSSLQSPQVVGCLPSHPSVVGGDSRGVPISHPPHSKGSHHGQGRVQGLGAGAATAYHRR